MSSSYTAKPHVTAHDSRIHEPLPIPTSATTNSSTSTATPPLAAPPSSSSHSRAAPTPMSSVASIVGQKRPASFLPPVPPAKRPRSPPDTLPAPCALIPPAPPSAATCSPSQAEVHLLASAGVPPPPPGLPSDNTSAIVGQKRPLSFHPPAAPAKRQRGPPDLPPPSAATVTCSPSQAEVHPLPSAGVPPPPPGLPSANSPSAIHGDFHVVPLISSSAQQHGLVNGVSGGLLQQAPLLANLSHSLHTSDAWEHVAMPGVYFQQQPYVNAAAPAPGPVPLPPSPPPVEARQLPATQSQRANVSARDRKKCGTLKSDTKRSCTLCDRPRNVRCQNKENGVVQLLCSHCCLAKLNANFETDCTAHLTAELIKKLSIDPTVSAEVKAANQARVDRRVQFSMPSRSDDLDAGERKDAAKLRQTTMMHSASITNKFEKSLAHTGYHSVAMSFDDSGDMVASSGVGEFVSKGSRRLAGASVKPLFLHFKKQNEMAAEKQDIKNLEADACIENIRYIFREATRKNSFSQGRPGWKSKEKMFNTWSDDAKSVVPPSEALSFARAKNFSWADPARMPISALRLILQHQGITKEALRRLADRSQRLPYPFKGSYPREETSAQSSSAPRPRAECARSSPVGAPAAVSPGTQDAEEGPRTRMPAERLSHALDRSQSHEEVSASSCSVSSRPSRKQLPTRDSAIQRLLSEQVQSNEMFASLFRVIQATTEWDGAEGRALINTLDRLTEMRENAVKSLGSHLKRSNSKAEAHVGTLCGFS